MGYYCMINIYFIISFWFLAAVLSTFIANKFFLPKHLLEIPILDDEFSESNTVDTKNN